MKRILVPVDFSETSVNALEYAVKFFKKVELEITVLHIYGTQSTALMMKSIDGILIKDAKKQLSELINKVKTEASHVVFKTKLAKSNAISTIANMGDTGDYDFIVMGTKGVSGLKEVFMGSVAGGVVSKTSAPVIVVPLDYAFKKIKNLVFAIGDDGLSNTSVLNPLRQIVEHNKSNLEILHISDKELTNFEDRMSSIADLNPTYTNKSGNGDLNQHLNVHIQNNNTDLLCLIRTKKPFFDRLFGGSVTLKQTFNSSVPLLVIHN